MKTPLPEENYKELNETTIKTRIKASHLLQLEKSLNLNVLFRQIQSLIPEFRSQGKTEELTLVPLSKKQLKGVKGRVYNFPRMNKNKRWLESVLMDKSDSDVSDFETDGSIPTENNLRDMMRSHNLHKKLRGETSDRLLSQHSNFSTSLLNCGHSLSSNNSLVKLKKVVRTAKSSKGKNSSSAPTPDSVVPVNLDAANTITDLPSIISNICPVARTIASDIFDTKRNKVESKMLDEIPYDTTLPDEILQSESSANVSELGTCCKPNMTNNIVYSSKLPDEIFDTEESNDSLISQPSKALSVTLLSEPKCMTAPTTPAGSRPNTPLPIAIKSEDDEKNDFTNHDASIERKRIWIAIATKEIPKAQEQKFLKYNEKLCSFKMMAEWCQAEKLRDIVSNQKQINHDNLLKRKELAKEMLVYWGNLEETGVDFLKSKNELLRQAKKQIIELDKQAKFPHHQNKVLCRNKKGKKKEELGSKCVLIKDRCLRPQIKK